MAALEGRGVAALEGRGVAAPEGRGVAALEGRGVAGAASDQRSSEDELSELSVGSVRSV